MRPVLNVSETFKIRNNTLAMKMAPKIRNFPPLNGLFLLLRFIMHNMDNAIMAGNIIMLT